jgi:hypothetical protein
MLRTRAVVTGEAHFILVALEKIGEDWFGIYLTYLFFISAFAFFLTRVGLDPDSLLFYLTLVFLTLISSYWSVQVLYRLPFSKIVGTPRKEETKLPQKGQISFAE